MFIFLKIVLKFLRILNGIRKILKNYIIYAKIICIYWYKLYNLNMYEVDLKRINIDGFRNLNDAIIEFNNFSVLLGRPNTGKSNFFEGISFALAFLKGTSDGRNLLLTRREYIPYNFDSLNKNLYIGILFLVKDGQNEYFCCYEVEAKRTRKDEKGGIIKEKLKFKKRDFKQKYETLLINDEKGCFYKSSPTGRCTNKIDLKAGELGIDYLVDLKDLYYVSLVKKIFEISIYNKFAFNTYAFFSLDANYFLENDLFKETDESTPKLFNYLKTNYKEKYSELEDAIKSIFTYVEEIYSDKVDVPELISFRKRNEEKDPDIYSLGFKFVDSIVPILFEETSYSFKLALRKLAQIALASSFNKEIIFIEDLDSNLPSVLLEKFLKFSLILAKKSKLVFSTNSAPLINLSKEGEYYATLKTQGGSIRVLPFLNTDKELLKGKDDIATLLLNISTEKEEKILV